MKMFIDMADFHCTCENWQHTKAHLTEAPHLHCQALCSGITRLITLISDSETVYWFLIKCLMSGPDHVHRVEASGYSSQYR